ncbi:MAG: hypothetical protein IJD39_02640 [Clostridia bacterium]|nr:hypothetical protein [Clostridia bacterium]
MKKKKLIVRLLPWLILLAALACLVIFVGIPLYGPKPASTLEKPAIYSYEGKEKQMTMENDHLLFEFDPATTYFKVTDKKSGQVWRSNPENADKDPLAISSNKEMMQSTFIVTYTTSGGNVDFNNFKYSIQNGNYEIIQQDDGSIRVNYAVGKIEKTYLIPTAITKVRYDEITSQMKKATVKKLSSNYSLYEPSKLDSKKNKDEIIALYPEVLNQPLYILKSGTSETNKKKIEGYFAEGGYSQEDFEIDQQLVAGKRETNEPVFNVSMVYRLDGKDLIVEVPYSEIRYREAYPITQLAVLPMFGAADNTEEGYMFIPEGGGALIAYNNGKLSQNSYYANMYGWDYATMREQVINETRNIFPVFGMIRKDASFLCMLEGATSYAGIQADISGRYNSYNWMGAKYNVIHYDKYNVSAKTAQLVYVYEKNVPDDTIIQRYRFMDTGDYVELANEYGEYLRASNEKLKDAVSSADVPVSVEMLGAIDKTVVKFGLPIDSVVATTTFAQAQQMLEELKASGLNNLQVRMSGWMNGGINQKVLTSVNVLNQLGGKEDMNKLIAAAKEKNVPLYFDGISCFAYDSGITEGFIPFNNSARYTTREQVKIVPYDVVIYQEVDWFDPYYLVQPAYAKEGANRLIAHLKEADAAGISFRDIGYLLSADYNPKALVTREEVKAMNIQTMKDAHDAGQSVMVRMGNDYVLPYADIITDMDLTGTRYSLIDQTIPFYQIAIHGMKDYTSESLTTTGDMRQEVLKAAEYGSGLNFTFIAENAKILQDTFYSEYFGSNYASRADEVTALALKYQQDMAGLNQQKIVAHQQITDTLTMTGYEDGTQVYVNYSKQDCEYDGITIPGYSYHVERGN